MYDYLGRFTTMCVADNFADAKGTTTETRCVTPRRRPEACTQIAAPLIFESLGHTRSSKFRLLDLSPGLDDLGLRRHSPSALRIL